MLSGCNSEQKAAGVLGYTQVTWDNESGKAPQPSSLFKAWAALTEQEKEAAVVLGYTEIIWNDHSGSESQPASADKHWIELTVCGERRRTLCMCACAPCFIVNNSGDISRFMPISFLT